MQIESYIVDQVVAAARETGWLCRPLQWRGRRDAPDYFFAKDGRVVLIEFKSPGEQPRAMQYREMTKLRLAGIAVHVADTVEKGLTLLGVE